MHQLQLGYDQEFQKMSLTSSQRPSPGTPFDLYANPVFGPRTPSQSSSSSRPQHAQPPHLYTIPGTPADVLPPKTPGGYNHNPRKTPLPTTTTARGGGGDMTASPASGYFGLDRDHHHNLAEESSYSHNNWSSASSSLRSVAARSPHVLDIDTMPTAASENFRRQSSAIAAHNKNHAANQRSRAGSRDMDADGGFFAGALKSPSTSSSSSKKVLSPRSEGEMQQRALRRESIYEEPQNYFDQPRYDSPATYDHSVPSRSVSASGWSSSSASMPHLLHGGPVAGDFSIRLPAERQRSSTLPPSSQVDGLSLMYASKLAQILDLAPKTMLLLDLRPFQQFSQSRIRGSINISIPTTLLKRPSFNIAKLTESLGGPEMKNQLARWKEVSIIVVYDAVSRTVNESASAAHTVSKFVREGWQGEAYLLSGGFEEFSEQCPGVVDLGPLQTETKKKNTLSLSGSSDGGPPAFNCVMPKAAANPFFSNIRQNMDLIGGVGEIALKIPPYITSEVRRAMPKWMRDVLKEDGAKKIAEKFLKLEKAEQRRMQDALNVNVTYESPKTVRPPQTHTLAGVEKGAKNRYNNIWPYDHTRVRLTDFSPESCDYINASYVSTDFSPKRYIATQGPIPHTFRDFWSVVWDHDVRVIVMLTAEAEGGQLKCHKYWKEHSYGPYQLNNISEKRIALDPAKTSGHLYKKDGSLRRQSSGRHEPESPKESTGPHVIMRKFTLSHSAHPFSPLREITQLQYSSWPDFGAPADPAHILALIEQTELVIRSSGGSRRSSSSNTHDRRSSRTDVERPVLVHCSAGCGRTGTFCATDSVIDMLRRQREYVRTSGGRYPQNGVDYEGDSPMRYSFDNNDFQGQWVNDDRVDLIERAVENLRDQRLSMVQTLRQYVLCYETVAEWLVRRPLADASVVSWMKN
ncbi:hypothetical protein TWF281_006460 [Arthrobotrys megalospora]